MNNVTGNLRNPYFFCPRFPSNGLGYGKAVIRKIQGMISALEGERGHGKVEVIREVAEFYNINQIQMRTRG